MMLLWAIEAARAGDGGLTVLPLGVGLYAHHEVGRGILYTATQAVGIGVGTWASVDAFDAIDQAETERQERDEIVSAVAIGTAALSYAVSIVDGSRLHEQQCDELSQLGQGLELWDRGREMALRSPHE